MRLARWKTVAGSCFLAALLSLPMLGADTDGGRQAMPGTLNYVEGQASIGDQALTSKQVGTAELENGQVLETGNGKAEILLTPGVYLRLGSNSAAEMVSTSLTNTQVALQRGEAMLEVDQIYKENFIHISQPGADTQVLKTGLYDFDATNQQMRVFDGKAIVSANDHNTTVKSGHELALNTENFKSRDFDKKQLAQNDDLYRWSSLRSQYLSEANINTAGLYYANGWYGPGWWGPGWYWNPWFSGFTFLPGAGFFYSPFGWGFYSPLVVWRTPYYGAYRGYYHFDGTRPVAIGSGFNNHAVSSFPGGMSGVPARGFSGAGFRGEGFGGGGFHGGGGGHR
jgi:hypothetical protein